MAAWLAQSLRCPVEVIRTPDALAITQVRLVRASGSIILERPDGKTAALIQVSLRAGALLGGGGDAAVEAVSQAGRALGLAFQIVDDILDVEGNLAELGKAAGSDEMLGFLRPYLRFHGGGWSWRPG